jgi:glycosyltransferase involved in cell wall biosynthesis
MASGPKKKRIGWVITDQLVTMPFWPRVDTGVGGVSLARLHWIALRVNNDPFIPLYYEVFKPWRSYDGLIFLKAMGDKALNLAKRYLDDGKPVIFDANVNYYTSHGTEYFSGMLPTLEQREEAIAITRIASAVIADSNYIANCCRDHNNDVTWIPDNVELDRVPLVSPTNVGQRIRLAWSGEAVKLFELLKIEESLRYFKNYIDLVVVTNELTAMSRWKSHYKQRMESLLSDLGAKIVRYQGAEKLFETYTQADVVISPRFLDSSYNLGHTEWKITLGMACGCKALVSSLPSYHDVWDRSSGGEIVLCDTQDDWDSAFETILSIGVSQDLRACSKRLVEKHYSSKVIADQHSIFLQRIFPDS